MVAVVIEAEEKDEEEDGSERLPNFRVSEVGDWVVCLSSTCLSVSLSQTHTLSLSLWSTHRLDKPKFEDEEEVWIEFQWRWHSASDPASLSFGEF